MIAVMSGWTVVGVAEPGSDAHRRLLATHPDATTIHPPAPDASALRLAGPAPDVRQILAAEAIQRATHRGCWTEAA